jgi:hypothetical protein
VHPKCNLALRKLSSANPRVSQQYEKFLFGQSRKFLF